jgi:hypothetical protein
MLLDVGLSLVAALSINVKTTLTQKIENHLFGLNQGARGGAVG